MNWIASLFSAFKVLKWLLAESKYQQKIENYLLAEKTWYFTLAAQLWNDLTLTSPVTPAALQAALAAKAAS